MNIIAGQFRSQSLLKIKKIVDLDENGDKFIIARRRKNIVRELNVDDCFAGPEEDRDPMYDGWVFKFKPMFEDVQLYIKIRIENVKKSVCLSVHEFGKYDGVS